MLVLPTQQILHKHMNKINKFTKIAIAFTSLYLIYFLMLSVYNISPSGLLMDSIIYLARTYSLHGVLDPIYPYLSKVIFSIYPACILMSAVFSLIALIQEYKIGSKNKILVSVLALFNLLMLIFLLMYFV